MGVLTKGVTFSDGDTVDAATLEDLMTEATLAGLTRQNLRISGTNAGGVAYRETNDPPGPYTGEPKIEVAKNETLSLYDGSNFVPGYPGVIKCQVWGAESGGVNQFDALMAINASGGTPIVAQVRSASPNNFFGVALEAGAALDQIFVQMSGEVTKVNVSEAVTTGNVMIISSVNGQLAPATTSQSGHPRNHAMARTTALGAGTVKAWLIK